MFILFYLCTFLEQYTIGRLFSSHFNIAPLCDWNSRPQCSRTTLRASQMRDVWSSRSLLVQVTANPIPIPTRPEGLPFRTQLRSAPASSCLGAVREYMYLAGLETFSVSFQTSYHPFQFPVLIGTFRCFRIPLLQLSIEEWHALAERLCLRLWLRVIPSELGTESPDPLAEDFYFGHRRQTTYSREESIPLHTSRRSAPYRTHGRCRRVKSRCRCSAPSMSRTNSRSLLTS